MVGGGQCTAGASLRHLNTHPLISFQYVPAPQESVIGIILGRSGEGWRVDLGAAHPALLDGLAFEGATKRSKPNLKVCNLPSPAFQLISLVGWSPGLCSRVSRTQGHGT